MALYRRPGSTYWWLDFEFEGSRHRLSTKCRSKRDAEKFAHAYRTDLANGKVSLEPKAKRAPTLTEAAEDYLAWSKLQNIVSTHKKYETASKAPLRLLGSRPITEIDRDSIEAFVKWRHVQKKKAPIRKLAKNKDAVARKVISPATVNKELAFLRILFNRLLDKGVVNKNPVSRFKFLKEDNDQLRVVDESEFRLYLMACSQPLRDVAMLMIETGMRPSEIFALRKQDVNLKTGYLQVAAGKTKSARRKIPILDAARSILTPRIHTSASEYIFAGGRGGTSEAPIVKLTNAHNAAVKRSKVKRFRLYDLRHTFATNAVQAGIDLVTLKDLLGHSRLDMVLRYAHPTEAHRLNAMERIRDYRKRV